MAQGYYGEHIDTYVPADKRNLAKALFYLQGRACVVASEILCLLEGGYADGAEARWRTLNEMAVVAVFLLNKGDVIAERYLEYRAVKDLTNARNMKKQAEKHLSHPEPNQSAATNAIFKETIEDLDKWIVELEDRVTNLCIKFEDSFKISNGYGWAAAAFTNNHRNRKVSLDEIADNLDSSLIPYAEFGLRAHANEKVHQGSAGDSRRGGDCGPTGTVLLGASPVGLYNPMSNTAQDLVVTTYTLLSVHPTWQSSVITTIIKSLAATISTEDMEIGATLLAKSLRIIT